MTNDQLILAWNNSKDALQQSKDAEMILRQAVAARFFPNPNVGTQRQELGNGYKLKLVHKINYKVDADIPKLNALNDQLAQAGNEGAFLASRLWKVGIDISVSEYKKLPEQYKTIVDKVLVTTPATPSLELESPKA